MKIAVNAAPPTQPTRNAKPVGSRPRRVQHQHGGDDRQRGEGNDKGKGDELGQSAGRHPRKRSESTWIERHFGGGSGQESGPVQTMCGSRYESFGIATMELVFTWMRL